MPRRGGVKMRRNGGGGMPPRALSTARQGGNGALRVAIVTPRFPPDLGGVERHVDEVARRLASRCRLTVLCTDRAGRLPAVEERDGFSVRRFRAWPGERDYYFAPGLYRA